MASAAVATLLAKVDSLVEGVASGSAIGREEPPDKARDALLECGAIAVVLDALHALQQRRRTDNKNDGTDEADAAENKMDWADAAVQGLRRWLVLLRFDAELKESASELAVENSLAWSTGDHENADEASHPCMEMLVFWTSESEPSPALAAACCQVARAVGGVSEEGRLAMAHAGFCEAIADVFLWHGQTSPFVAEHAARAIRNLTVHTVPVKERLMAAGVGELLVTHAFRPHGLTHPVVAERVCWSLGNLLSARTEDAERVKAAGVCELMLSHALLPHGRQHPSLVAAVCRALCTVAQTLALRRWCCDLGLCPIIVCYVSMHARSHYDTATGGTRLLIHLGHMYEEGRAQLVQAGACELLTQVLHSWSLRDPCDWKAVKVACAAATTLVRGNSSHMQRLGDAGFCEALTSFVLQTHTDDVEVLYASYSVLSNMTPLADNCRRLRRSGALYAVVTSALHRHEVQTPQVLVTRLAPSPAAAATIQNAIGHFRNKRGLHSMSLKNKSR